MKEKIKILAGHIDPEQFAPFGELVALHNIIELDFGGSQPTLQISSVPYREFVFKEMSRHIHCSQIFIPMNGKEFIIALAPPSDNNDPFAVPDINSVKAFVVDSSQVINIQKGCWHTTPFPFCHKSTIATMQCKETFKDDLDIKKLKANVEIHFE